jgi:imidazolonepropionase-like amidohydrolase
MFRQRSSVVAAVVALLLPASTQSQQSTVLVPSAVFDGVSAAAHSGWIVVVSGNSITYAGPTDNSRIPPGAKRIDLAGTTLLPGLIDAHVHFFLHPYNEAPWDDQVLKESLALRIARATNHARNTLLAGFTTVRDLGTEGAQYADAGLRQAINTGIIPGPRYLIASKAIVATGSYAPSRPSYAYETPLGAERMRRMGRIYSESFATRSATEPTGSSSTVITGGAPRARRGRLSRWKR